MRSLSANVGNIDPDPAENAVWGKYSLRRGWKVYELNNHLGNVLAVVSDMKIGKSASSPVAHYLADVVEMTEELATNRTQV